MYRKISLTLVSKDESDEEIQKDFGFLACATTGFRYKQLFGTELLSDITGILNNLSPVQLSALTSASNSAPALAEAAASEGEEANTIDPLMLSAVVAIAGSGKMDTISKMAFIMNKQAEGANMRNLEMDDYLDWLEQFESTEFLGRSLDFIALYLANRQGSSTLKKDIALSTAK